MNETPETLMVLQREMEATWDSMFDADIPDPVVSEEKLRRWRDGTLAHAAAWEATLDALYFEEAALAEANTLVAQLTADRDALRELVSYIGEATILCDPKPAYERIRVLLNDYYLASLPPEERCCPGCGHTLAQCQSDGRCCPDCNHAPGVFEASLPPEENPPK